MEYRHPVQGWTMALPVEDAADPPEVFYLRGARLERADLQPPAWDEALVLVGARRLQQEEEPGAWDLLPLDRRDHYLARARVIFDAWHDEGAFA